MTTTTRPVRRGLERPITASDAEQEPAEERLKFAEPEPPTFTRGPARRPLAPVADPLLQWSTGLPTRDRRVYAGWLCEFGKNGDLDEAMHEAHFSQVEIRHGGGNLVVHWAVETASVFVVAEGVQSIGEMKHTSERYGIAFGWKTLEGGRQQSQLRCRVFLRELLTCGYTEPLLLTVKSTLTGDLLAALSRQYDVLDAVDAFRAADKKPPLQPPFYACSIPLGPGAEVARGSVQTREITPMVARVPSPVTKEHIRAHWTRRDWVALVEGMLDDTIRWSRDTSLGIEIGEEERQSAEYA